MWLFNAVPKEAIKQRYGFEVTDAWLTRLQRASVRFNNGGSGSFVSADGLVLTNHHVAADTLQKLSSAGQDYVREGFLAKTRAEELKAPDLELNVLESIEDVTSHVNDVIATGMSPAEERDARQQRIAAIERASLDTTGLRSDVVTLYGGAQYHVYRYRRYTDVRLVFAPDFDIAFFGGDPDNFTYPRFDLDMALVRVYEDGQPARVKDYLKWSSHGAEDGDLVFVSGHPGSTQRLDTVADLEYQRDVALPYRLAYLEGLHRVCVAYGARGAEQQRQAGEVRLGVENSLKALRGRLAGLKDDRLMARKGREEHALRQRLTQDGTLRAKYGDPWAAIARSRRSLAAFRNELVLLEEGDAFSSYLVELAHTLVRLAAEDQKVDAERLPEFTSARRESLELDLYSPAPIYAEFEKARLAWSLGVMRATLGANHPILEKVLGRQSPDARAAELVDGTKLAAVAVRKELAGRGPAAIERSTDPMIMLARAIDPDARSVRTRYEREIESVERLAYANIARAHFDVMGDDRYPDATFTLRLSYGAVKGYQENGRAIQPFTTFAGLFARADEHGHRPPYRLPERWLSRRGAIDGSVPLNVVTTNDIIGGNSGSPVVDTRGELVGLVFDGNIHSLVGDFVYDDTLNRTVSVDVRAMRYALAHVYNATGLIEELDAR
ncbi:MAG: S46 family peptidase [Luteitalea sp.]|nr:S46 family peptidase [Luteitalea sp.]